MEFRPRTDLAMTRRMLCSRPSPRRWDQRSIGSDSGGAGSTQTSPSLTVTGKDLTSSAKGSKVPPLERSKRAWCQWQVRMPFLTVPLSSGKPMWGHLLSTAAKASSRGNTAMVCPPPVTTTQPRRFTSSTSPTLIRFFVAVVMVASFRRYVGLVSIIHRDRKDVAALLLGRDFFYT